MAQSISQEAIGATGLPGLQLRHVTPELRFRAHLRQARLRWATLSLTRVGSFMSAQQPVLLELGVRWVEVVH